MSPTLRRVGCRREVGWGKEKKKIEYFKNVVCNFFSNTLIVNGLGCTYKTFVN